MQRGSPSGRTLAKIDANGYKVTAPFGQQTIIIR